MFGFAGWGGLNQNSAGDSGPKDTIGQIQLETVPWEERKDRAELDDDIVIDELSAALQEIPGIQIEVLELGRGPATAKPVHLRLKGDNWEDLLVTTADMRALFDETEAFTQIEDTQTGSGEIERVDDSQGSGTSGST